MIGKVYKKRVSSSDIVNGIIEQYKASTSTIDANSFVEFVNNMSTGIDTTLVATKNSYLYANAVLIDTNKVFIAHSNNSSNYYLNGIVCTISGTTITTGTDTTIIQSANLGVDLNAITIDTNKVFITHSSDSTNRYLNGIVCTISGTTITKGSDTTLVNVRYSSMDDGSNIAKIDTNKVFIAHRDSSSYLSGFICTINGTTITKGSDTTLISQTSSYGYPQICLIDTNKVFITHRSDSTNAYLNGIVCTISGTTITAGTDITLVSASYSANSYCKICLIDTNKVFIAHSSGSSTNYYLQGMVCTISGTTITKGSDTTLVNANYSSVSVNAVLIDTNKVFIAHSNDNTNYYLNGIVCTVSGSTITTGTDTTLINANRSSYRTSATLIDTNKVFIAHSSDNTNQYLNGIMVVLTPTIKTSESKIEGLTKEEITTSTAGDVWVLNQ